MTSLRALRTAKGFTQQQLADLAGVARQTISSLERGDGNPTREVMERLASSLGGKIGDIAGATPARPWSLRYRQLHMQNLLEIVQRVGKKIMDYDQQVKDTSYLHGHASSTIDKHAQLAMVTAFTEVYDSSRIDRDWVINLEFEDASASVSGHTYFPTDDEKRHAPVAILDEIDGTTNVKRSVAATLGRGRPKSAVCIALKNRPDSPDIECGAIFAFDEGVTFGGFLAEDGYIATRNGAIIGIGECDFALGDSTQRVIVANYSNSNHVSCAWLKQAIEATVADGNCQCYGGCRSSTIDVIDIIRNQYDAYVDCRELWTTDFEQNSVLRVYDVAAALPIARGAGLKVVRPNGEDFSLEGVKGHDPMSVIIGRPQVVEQIIAAIAPVLSDHDKIPRGKAQAAPGGSAAKHRGK